MPGERGSNVPKNQTDLISPDNPFLSHVRKGGGLHEKTSVIRGTVFAEPPLPVLPSSPSVRHLVLDAIRKTQQFHFRKRNDFTILN